MNHQPLFQVKFEDGLLDATKTKKILINALENSSPVLYEKIKETTIDLLKGYFPFIPHIDKLTE